MRFVRSPRTRGRNRRHAEKVRTLSRRQAVLYWLVAIYLSPSESVFQQLTEGKPGLMGEIRLLGSLHFKEEIAISTFDLKVNELIVCRTESVPC